MKARFIHENGTTARLRVYWEGHPTNGCPNCGGSGKPGYHNAEFPLGETDELKAYNSFGKPEDFSDDRWPTKCDHCPSVVPPGGPYGHRIRPDGFTVNRQVFVRRRYNTASGKPEPGDLLLADWYHHKSSEGKMSCLFWDNCTEYHVMAKLPNGEDWDIMSRASNCGLPNDRLHRCWVTHGKAEDGTIHVDKEGLTCAAGAGSIAVPGYHGFLHHGNFT